MNIAELKLKVRGNENSCRVSYLISNGMLNLLYKVATFRKWWTQSVVNDDVVRIARLGPKNTHTSTDNKDKTRV